MPLYEGIGLINEKLPVVLEIGNSLTKAGFAGENCPRVILPSLCKLRWKDGSFTSIYLHTIKDEAELNLALVDFLNNIYFRHLLVTPKERRVVILESLFTSAVWRNTLARVLYIHYEVLSILWIPTHLTASVGIGNDTALILDIGQVEANVIPLVHGVTLLSNIISYELGAAAFDANLKELMMKHAHDPKDDLGSRLPREVLEDVRIRSCFVAPMARAEKFDQIETLEPKLGPFMKDVGGKEVVTFNGVVRELGAEIWFQTDDLDGVSLPQMILDVLLKCPIDTRRTLAKNILISGGTPMIPGLEGRLIRELKQLITERSCYRDKLSCAYEFRILKLPVEPNCASWYGGSVYGSSESMTLKATSKDYFLKHGQLPDWSAPPFTTTYFPPFPPATLPNQPHTSGSHQIPTTTSRRI